MPEIIEKKHTRIRTSWGRVSAEGVLRVFAEGVLRVIEEGGGGCVSVPLFGLRAPGTPRLVLCATPWRTRWRERQRVTKRWRNGERERET